MDPETRTMWEELRLCYTDPEGPLPLRQEIASTYDTIQARAEHLK